MSFKPWCLALLTSLGLNACWSKSADPEQAEDFGFFKNPESRAACLSANISQWSLSGEFLHRMLRCASNRSTDGGDSMPALQNLLAQLDPQRTQALLDFVLTVDSSGQTHEERYPYLLALSTLLDRGLLDGRERGLNLTEERLENLQSFLLDLDTKRTQNLLSQWARNGKLALVLNELGSFLNLLADDSVEALSHELLAGMSLRPEMLALGQEMLAHEDLFHPLAQTWQKQDSQLLSPDERERLRENLREARTSDDPSALPVAAAADRETWCPLAQVLALHQSWLPADLEKLNLFVQDIWSGYKALAERERASLDRRLTQAAEHFADQQVAPLQWSLSILSDARRLGAASMKKVSKSLEQLLLEGNNLSLEAIRAKSGASKLLDALRTELSLAADGRGRLCTGFQASSLEGDFAALVREMARVSSPQADCGGQIPLLTSIQNLTGTTFKAECDGNACVTAIAPPAGSAYWSKDYADADPKLLKTLLDRTLAETRFALHADRSYLSQIGLAKASVTPEHFARLSARIQEHDDFSLRGLAALDLQLNEADELRAWLLPDFLEGLMADKLERLSSLSHQFADLNSGSEQHSARVFAGVYADGPIEQNVRQRLGSDQLLNEFTASEEDQALLQYLRAQPGVWKRILSRAKFSEGIFRFPELPSLNAEDKVAFNAMGSSLRNFMSFDENLQASAAINPAGIFRILQPAQAIAAFSDQDQGQFAWALWGQQFANGPANAKDVPAPLTKDLQRWLAQSFLPSLSNPQFWPALGQNLSPTSAITRDFYDVEDYSADDARMLAFYYLRNYLKHAPALPAAAQIQQGKSSLPKTDVSSFADPIRGFMNGSYLVREDSKAEFTSFRRFFPSSFLSGGSSESLSAFKARQLPDQAGFEAKIADWAFADQAQVTDVSRVPFTAESPFALLSTLNLLTYSKPQTRFLPQPLVGFGAKLCRNRVKTGTNPVVETKVSCPLEFTAETEGAAYEMFREYISSQAAQYACAFIADSRLGSPEIWQQRLGLQLDNPGLCSSASAAPLPPELIFPEAMARRILDDIFTMGKRASLKAGLAQVPAGMRYYKLAAKTQKPVDLAAWLAQSKGLWDAKSTSVQRRREYFAGAFWAGQPSLLSSYVNSMSQNLDPYAWRNTLIAYAETDAQGQRRDTVRDIIRILIEEQRRHEAEGKSLIALGLSIQERLTSREDFLAFTAHLLGSTATLETYDFSANELPLALISLFPEDGPEANPFDWNDPGIQFLKYLGQGPALRTWADASRQITDSEISRFLRQMQQSLQLLGSPAEQTRIVERLAADLEAIGSLWLSEPQRSVASFGDEALQVWRRTRFSLAFQESWRHFVSRIDQPLQTWDKLEVLTGDQALRSMLSALFQRGPQLVHSLQDATEQDEPLFWVRYAQSFLHTLKEQPLGSAALAGFLSQPRLDFGSGKIWEKILKPGLEQDRFAGAMVAVEAVPQELWRAALIEGTELSVRLHRALSFLKERLVWKVDPDHNAYRITLDRVLAISEDSELRNKQNEVLTLWLREEETPTVANSRDSF